MKSQQQHFLGRRSLRLGSLASAARKTLHCDRLLVALRSCCVQRSIRPGTGGVPVWVLVVAGLVILCGCVFVALVFATGSLLRGLGKQVVDPAAAAKVAAEIVVLKGPLPQDWSYSAGINAGPMKVAMLRNDKLQTSITITRYADTGHPEKVVDGASKGAGITIEEQGQESIGGRKFNFVRGPSSGKEPIAMEMATVATDNGALILIHSIEQGKVKFDRSFVQPVFDCVTEFK